MQVSIGMNFEIIEHVRGFAWRTITFLTVDLCQFNQTLLKYLKAHMEKLKWNVGISLIPNFLL